MIAHILMNPQTKADLRSALIGYTGLVGNNLARQFRFNDLYNSSNIHEIENKHYEFLVCGGVSGTKWIANKQPDKDKAAIAGLSAHLKTVRVSKLILISTVDVYGIPDQVTENTPIDTTVQTPYGRNRHEFEQMILEHFDDVLIARLPAVYGWLLKKNALYDLMHRHELEKINADAVYQFYWLEHLWRDLCKCIDSNLKIVNFATEPLGIRSVAEEIFGIELQPPPNQAAPCYNFKTVHDAVFNGSDGYFYDKMTAMEEIRTFVAQQRLCSNYTRPHEVL